MKPAFEIFFFLNDPVPGTGMAMSVVFPRY